MEASKEQPGGGSLGLGEVVQVRFVFRKGRKTRRDSKGVY